MLTREEQLERLRLARTPKAKPAPKGIKPVSDKKAAQIKEQKKSGESSELDEFFETMLKQCTGKCLFCNANTTAFDPKFWRNDNPNWSEEANDKKYEREIEVMKRAAVAHLLPKSNFPSIAANDQNWIELCWQCHTSFDTGKITWEFIHSSAEWLPIREKLLRVLPAVAPQERSQKLYGKLWEMCYGKTNKEI